VNSATRQCWRCSCASGTEGAILCSIVQRVQRRRAMIANRFMILGALLAFSANSVYAGPCTTVSRDAGSGNVPGYTGQTTGSTATDSKQQPPTSSMSKASENTATSSEDAQRQMQSQPTAAEQSKATHPAPSAQSPDRTAGTASRPAQRPRNNQRRRRPVRPSPRRPRKR
jgi:hypothetical protein